MSLNLILRKIRIPAQRLIRGFSGISLKASKYSRAAIWCWLIMVNWCAVIRIGGTELLCLFFIRWRNLLCLKSRLSLKLKMSVFRKQYKINPNLYHTKHGNISLKSRVKLSIINLTIQICSIDYTLSASFELSS